MWILLLKGVNVVMLNRNLSKLDVVICELK